MGKYGVRHEVPNDERVRILLEDERPRYDTSANDSVVINSLGENIRTRKEILDIIDRLADGRKIIYAPGVSKALEVAKARHPHYSFDSHCFEKRILDKCEELKFNI